MKNTPPINVLYLDDEEHNLQSFKASFRRSYVIFTTSSPEEAIEILDNNEIHVLLVDQRMPVITGVQFFEKIRTRFPNPIRILITGHTDIGAAMDAINKGEVFRFIDKPWDSTYVENAITHGYEIYATRKELKTRNEELEKAYEELDKFVYSASHDLRSPLMSILGIVSLAEPETEKSELLHYFELIKHSVVKLDSFITSIIDYYRNTRGTEAIQEIDFKELLADILTAIEYLPEFKRLNIQIDVKQQGSFKSDVVKLRIVLNNLLSNAVKFQQPNNNLSKLNIFINSFEDKCTIKIEDNGIGIAQNELENIFKMFYRAESFSNGSGLGLYIVQEAIAKLKGVIQVQSTLNVGTTFEITLPSA